MASLNAEFLVHYCTSSSATNNATAAAAAAAATTNATTATTATNSVKEAKDDVPLTSKRRRVAPTPPLHNKSMPVKLEASRSSTRARLRRDDTDENEATADDDDDGHHDDDCNGDENGHDDDDLDNDEEEDDVDAKLKAPRPRGRKPLAVSRATKSTTAATKKANATVIEQDEQETTQQSAANKRKRVKSEPSIDIKAELNGHADNNDDDDDDGDDYKAPSKSKRVPVSKAKKEKTAVVKAAKCEPVVVNERPKREAGLKASAMIIQTNEIEKTRYQYQYSTASYQPVSTNTTSTTPNGYANNNHGKLKNEPSQRSGAHHFHESIQKKSFLFF